ncbi:hypothetical protein SAMN06265365_102380 [Tistlia consotensis]|uniref:NAD(P)-dependent dehydrogenase, short-chain alcohol dehydrogenase family n=1 Tax=Tistlia consotensis USBA 355 TaxID=560819 RepID=A0A1Y6C1N4_9PROT|nr:SDR family NAD(P)-dependent oxidoreductase [Tistlia consotensis]SMF38893.1 hypothetical protein SAMN05428998_11383 [Tistlia consotensis USBA 355]SNR36742.1 hypothetical protein SAMN06265365_102380 [Tistlia consotensis]
MATNGRSGEDGPLAGQVALVTGGGSGIGEAIVRRFAAAGATVFLTGRSLERLRPVAESAGATALAADVSREEEVERLFAALAEQAGQLDVLVNNAGVSGPVKPVAEMDLDAWDECIAINLRGAMLCMRAAARMMLPRRSGCIVNMSSRMGLQGYPMRSAYSATKFALIGMTEAVARELGPSGIRVNALCPGAVSGVLMERVIARRAEAEGRPAEAIIRENYTDVAALRRWVAPEEVAEAALFLASDAAAAITGERIKVDAGRF